MRFTVREIASWMGIVNFLLQRLAKVPCYVNDSLIVVWIHGALIQVFQPVLDFARSLVTL